MKGLNLWGRSLFISLLKLLQILTRTNIWNAGLLLMLAFFCWLMASITMAYVPYNTDVGFLRIKQDYISINQWRIAFFIHVYASMWVLFAGFTQFSKGLLRNKPKLHRTLGYIYVVDVLLITGPAGLLMGFYANGGLLSKIGFISLAVLWIVFTAIALIKARLRKFKAHRKYMILSYAMTLSAITLRAWKYVITNTMTLPPMDVYRVVAWLGWAGNLLIALYIIRRTRNKKISLGKREIL
ncbi:MAG: DUF2306 domain-containing protein [Chitinophagaceae bacterium]